MTTTRTPDSCFDDLEDYPFEAHYADVDGLRMHHVDEGDSSAAPVLMLHGEPTWSYLYRHMIPVCAAGGSRVIAPDLVGFGKSDKPAEKRDYTYQRHVDWMTDFIRALDLRGITLFCQDWGALIGLRVAAENEARFARIVIGNGALPSPTVMRVRISRTSPRSWHGERSRPTARSSRSAVSSTPGACGSCPQASAARTTRRSLCLTQRRARGRFPGSFPSRLAIRRYRPIARHGRHSLGGTSHTSPSSATGIPSCQAESGYSRNTSRRRRATAHHTTRWTLPTGRRGARPGATDQRPDCVDANLRSTPRDERWRLMTALSGASRTVRQRASCRGVAASSSRCHKAVRDKIRS